MTATPFPSVEVAWFSTMRSIRYSKARRTSSQAEEIVKCLDTLYRQRRIELLHARILRIWGLRGIAPNPAHVRERSDWRIWREALALLEAPLRARGIVGGKVFDLFPYE